MGVLDRFTFLVAGKAGQGVRKAGTSAARMFARMGRRAFQMDDYQSLIKGGHNFSVVSTSTGPITSHYMAADLVVALDDRSYRMHKTRVADGGALVFNSDETKNGEGIGLPMRTEAKKYPKSELRLGLSAIAVLCAAMGMDRGQTSEFVLREYPRDVENNAAFATAIFELVLPSLGGRFPLQKGDRARPVVTGNEAISMGAVAGGLDMYFAYPMTPSSSILHFLAAHDRDFGVTVVHPENEIAVANMAIGAAFMGARVMVGSSGGGFALMEEAFSLAGMTETPLLCVLGSRPGPSTGVPTYTAQSDLRFALNQGHGEFPRLVASPGSVEEAFYLASEMLALVWKFQTPGIILTEKHLAESAMTVEIDPERAGWPRPLIHQGGEYKRYLDTEDGVSPLLFPPSKELIKWDSYEHDEGGITTEEPGMLSKMADKRRRKAEALKRHLAGMLTVNVFGTGVPIFTYGSTVMSVQEALRAGGLEAQVVQPVYLEPFPAWELERFRGKGGAVVEQSSTGLFADLLREKGGIDGVKSITRYDGRPFEPLELAAGLKEVL